MSETHLNTQDGNFDSKFTQILSNLPQSLNFFAAFVVVEK